MDPASSATLEVQAYADAAFNHDHVVALEMAAEPGAVAIENVKLYASEVDLRKPGRDRHRTKTNFIGPLARAAHAAQFDARLDADAPLGRAR